QPADLGQPELDLRGRGRECGCLLIEGLAPPRTFDLSLKHILRSRAAMHGNVTLSGPRLGTFVLIGLIATHAVSAGEDDAPQPRLTPVERLAPAHLKAAHADAIRIQEGRRSLPTTAGLNDYRTILHAHAEDSDHTGGTRPEMLAEAKRAGVHAILLTDHYRP